MLKNTAAGVLAVLLLTSVVHSAELPFGGIDVGRGLVQSSIQDYYSIFGHWPANWVKVQEAGLAQVPIVSVAGSAIDPDDTKIDFAGDLIYYIDAEGNPTISQWLDLNGTKQVVTNKLDEPLQRSNPVGENPAQQVNLVLLRSLTSTGFMFFTHTHKRLPASWKEFIDSGVTPINSSSINGLTGRPYMGNGLPGDFKFTGKIDEQGKVVGVSISWVDLSGKAVNPFGNAMLTLPPQL